MSDETTVEDLLTVEEAAEVLRVRPRWLYERTAAGKFPHVKTGRYTRIRRSDLRDYIANGGDRDE